MRALPRPGKGRRVFVPKGTARDEIAKLHEAGWRTIQGLEDTAGQDEAARLGCSHVLRDGTPKEIGEKE